MRQFVTLLSVFIFVFSSVALAQDEFRQRDMYMVEIDTTAIKLDRIEGIPVKRLYAIMDGVPAQGVEETSLPIFEKFTAPPISTSVLKVPMARHEMNDDLKALVGFGNGENQYGGGKGGPIFAGPPIKIPRTTSGSGIVLGPFKLDGTASAAIANSGSDADDMTMVFVKRQ